MTDILKTLIDAMTARINAAKLTTDARDGSISALQTCNKVVAHTFAEAKINDPAKVTALCKAAYTTAYGEEPKTGPLSEYVLIANAGMSGIFDPACDAVDAWIVKCKADKVPAGQRQRNLLNLLRDVSDGKCKADVDGVRYGIASRNDVVAKTWKAFSEAAVTINELLQNAGSDVRVNLPNVSGAMFAAFPDTFAPKAKGKKSPVVVVPVAPQPAPQPAPVETSPQIAGMDLKVLLGMMGDVVDQKMAAFQQSKKRK